jgi:hypothetical protein
MSNRSFVVKGLKYASGREITFEVQFFTYLVWTAPERGMTARDLRKAFKRVCEVVGERPTWFATQRFAWSLMSSCYVRAYWLRPGFYLDDEAMELRQRCVFQELLRDTPFDKMDRIRKRYETPGVPYARQGRETCDPEELIRFLGGLKEGDVERIRRAAAAIA